MPKRRRTPPSAPGKAPKPDSRETRADIVHTSVYLPLAVHEGLLEAAFRERCKIRDVVFEGLNWPRKRGWRSNCDSHASKRGFRIRSIAKVRSPGSNSNAT
jgi:hypothetical protein